MEKLHFLEIEHLREMPTEKFKAYLQKLKENYDQMRQQNVELNEKLHRQNRKEQRMKEEQKQAILQAETVSMMTKYQLVFVKMENAFAKVFNSNKLRNLSFKQDAFLKIQERALSQKLSVNYRTHMVFERLKSKHLRALVCKYEKKRVLITRMALQKWKGHTQLPQLKARVEASQSRELDEVTKKKEGKILELQERENGLAEKEKQFRTAAQKLKELKGKVEELERKERKINQEIQALLYKNTTQMIQQNKGTSSQTNLANLQHLEQQLSSVKKENHHMKEKLEMSEVNMGAFIREMNTLLDQHELGGALNDILNEEYQLGGNIFGRRGRNEDEGGDGSTGGSIRRSKQ